MFRVFHHTSAELVRIVFIADFNVTSLPQHVMDRTSALFRRSVANLVKIAFWS